MSSQIKISFNTKETSFHELEPEQQQKKTQQNQIHKEF